MKPYQIVESIEKTLSTCRRALLRRAMAGHRIVLRATVDVWNGDKHLVHARNHFVGQGLIGLANIMGGIPPTTAGSSASSGLSAYYLQTSGTSNAKMYLGTDTATATTFGTTALTAPIGTAPGTLPSAMTIQSATDNTTYVKLIFVATWNAGTVSGTVGELGLYGYEMYLTLGSGALTTSALLSRLSTKDGDFTAFTINTANALAVTWTIELVFA